MTKLGEPFKSPFWGDHKKPTSLYDILLQNDCGIELGGFYYKITSLFKDPVIDPLHAMKHAGTDSLYEFLGEQSE